MNPEEHVEPGGPSKQPYLSIKEVLPADVIIYLGDYMTSKDYVNFIRAVWPNHDEDESVGVKLWNKSTHRMRVKFLNGEYLNIEYNYDHTRIDRQRVLINVKTLLPVFGGLVPANMATFMDVQSLNAYVETCVRLNECRAYAYASCPCHLDVVTEAAGEFEPPSVTGCADSHYHHFCSQHVNYWLLYVLGFSIKNLEEDSFDEEATTTFVEFLENTVYFRDGKPQLRSSRSCKVL